MGTWYHERGHEGERISLRASRLESHAIAQRFWCHRLYPKKKPVSGRALPRAWRKNAYSEAFLPLMQHPPTPPPASLHSHPASPLTPSLLQKSPTPSHQASTIIQHPLLQQLTCVVVAPSPRPAACGPARTPERRQCCHGEGPPGRAGLKSDRCL